jgi:hypothetical protein
VLLGKCEGVTGEFPMICSMGSIAISSIIRNITVQIIVMSDVEYR